MNLNKTCLKYSLKSYEATAGFNFMHTLTRFTYLFELVKVLVAYCHASALHISRQCIYVQTDQINMACVRYCISVASLDKSRFTRFKNNTAMYYWSVTGHPVYRCRNFAL